MNRTLSFVVAGVAAGVLAGVAVGYWEARPWTIGKAPPRSTTTPLSPVADPAEPIAAQADVPETTYRFGNMESGSTQSHVFPVRNTGTGPLTVNYVSHTCKCTEVRMNDKPAEPGDTIIVPAHSEASITLQWSAKVDPSPFRHGASFTTNDPKLGRLELTVEGEIVASATLEPARLSFGTVHVGQPGKAELVVMSFLEPKVEILSHEVIDEALAKRIQITVEPVAADKLPNQKAKDGVRVVATYEPGETAGPFAGTLRLHTNLEKSPVREVPIFGVVKGDVWVFGPGWSEEAGLLRMAPVNSAKGGESTLFVNIRGEHAGSTEIRVAEDGVSPPELTATVGKPKKIRDGLVQIPLTVGIPAGTRPMVRAGEDHGGEGEIVLATTHPLTSKVRLRVHFTVQP